MVLNNFVDKTYIINLDERKDRWETVQIELKKAGLFNYERFSAVKPLRKNLAEEEFNKMRLAGSDKEKYLIACCGVKRSHIEIMKIAKKNRYNKILILEDDVVFHKDTNIIFDKAIKQIEENKLDWDMLFLGAFHKTPFISLSENVCRITRSYAIHAYILKSTLYDFLIANAINSGKEIDVYYADLVIPKYNCLCVRPHIAWQRAGFSDILQGFRDYEVLRI